MQLARCRGPVAATATSSALRFAGLGRDYGERPALRDVSFIVDEGATVAVLGANGAGKTTLLRIACGLLSPTSGDVKVLGHDLPKEAWALRGKVGFLGHQPMLYSALTVRENLAYQARLLKVDKARPGELIEVVGLSGRADEPLRNLSRGMVQRAAAARALLADPPLMLLDEPYANLDPAGRELLQPLLEDGRTVLVSGHDPAALLASAERAVGLLKGKLAFEKTAAEVSDADLDSIYGRRGR